MKKEIYKPQYLVSSKALNLISEIAAAVERYRILLESPGGLRLRKINHIRTLRGTTAIEGNTLTEEQITAILEGKRIAGSKREIAEIKGAHEAYAAIESFDPYSIEDFLKAHGLMTKELLKNPGNFRNCNVGVVDGFGNVVHMAPPYLNVPSLMKGLFEWLTYSEDPILVKSCVFHYELEFIHPFQDGNGRMGRFWQSVLLGSWRREFYGASVENIIWAHQQEYYQAIRTSTSIGECGPFIDFMLDKILRALRAKGEEVFTTEKTTKKTTEKNRDKILAIIKSMPDVTLTELANATGLSVDGVRWNIRKLKDANIIRRVGPDKGGRWEIV